MDNNRNRKLIKASLIRFDLPFMINLPNSGYDISLDDIKATVTIERTNSSRNMPGLNNGVFLPNTTSVLGDRWGRLNYSKIRITFHHDVFIRVSPLLPYFLLPRAVKAINRIFSVCRGIKGDHYIRISEQDIFSYDIFYFGLDGVQIDESVHVPFGSSVLSMGGASNPTNQELIEIEKILATNVQLPVFQELLLDAWDYNFYGNYRAAAIEANTAFEVFIDDFIWNGYLQKGKTEKEIEKILEAGFMNLLCHHIKKLTGHDFTSTQEFNIWKTDAYKIRNDTIHKGKKVSENESSKAITTVADTIKFILSLK